MEQIEIRTAQNVGIDFEAAGLGDRTIAALTDYLVLAAYVISVSILFSAIGGAPSWAFFTILLLPYLSYFLLCEVFFDGQSIGKRARGLRVVRLDGGPPTLGSYLLRWLLRPVDILMTSGLAAVLCILITGTGQRLGDLAAGTAVVKRPPDARLGDTLFRRLDEAHALTFPEVDRLSRADAETVRDVLDALRADGRAPATRALSQRLKAGLEQKMGVTSDLSAPRFLHAVLEDYNHVQGRV